MPRISDVTKHTVFRESSFSPKTAYAIRLDSHVRIAMESNTISMS